MDPEPDDEVRRREQAAYEQGFEHAVRTLAGLAYDINNLSVAIQGHLSLARLPGIATAESTARTESAERTAHMLQETARQLLQCLAGPHRMQAETTGPQHQESAREREDRERAVFEEHLDIALHLLGGLTEDVSMGAFAVLGLSELASQQDVSKEESTEALAKMARIARNLGALATEARWMCMSFPGVAPRALDGAEWLRNELPSWSTDKFSSLRVEIDPTAEDLRFDCVHINALSLAIQRLLEHRICANIRIETGEAAPEPVTLSARRIEVPTETSGTVGAHVVLSLPTPGSSLPGAASIRKKWPLGASTEPWGTEPLLKAYLFTRQAGGRLRFEPSGDRGPCFEIWLPASHGTS